MAELTPEERQKIYEEEKARKEAQDTLKKDQSKKQSEKVAKGCLGCLVVIIIGFAVLSIFGRNRQVSTDSSNISSVPAPAVESPLKLEEFDWKTGEYGNNFLVGTVKNNSSKQFSYAQISFNLYDNNKNQVGTALANINNLEPNGTWKFEAVVLEDNATTAKFKELTGY